MVELVNDRAPWSRKRSASAYRVGYRSDVILCVLTMGDLESDCS